MKRSIPVSNRLISNRVSRPPFLFSAKFTPTSRFPEAIEASGKYVELSGGTRWAKLELAHVYAVAGNKSESDRIVNEATTLRTDFSSYDMATIYSAQDDISGALPWLEKALGGCCLDQG